MTATLDGVTSKRAEPTAEAEAARELVRFKSIPAHPDETAGYLASEVSASPL